MPPIPLMILPTADGATDRQRVDRGQPPAKID
jgi:hypothetical protein